MEKPTITAADFHEFITKHAGEINPRKIRELVSRLPAMRAKFREVETPAFPRTPAQLDLLADAVEAFASGINEELPLVAAAEAAFAINYLNRNVDVVPDVIPELGFADDATIAALVLARNEVAFRRFAAAKGVEWENIAPGEGK